MKISRPAFTPYNGTAAVTAKMALRFACLTGGAPELYLKMQPALYLEFTKRRLQPNSTTSRQGGRANHPMG